MTNHHSSERDPYDEDRRSIFSALWFRALIVVLVLGVIVAVAMPYVLDYMNPPARQALKAIPRAAVAPAAPPAPAPPAATSAPAATSPPALPPPSPPASAAATPPSTAPVAPAKPAPPVAGAAPTEDAGTPDLSAVMPATSTDAEKSAAAPRRASTAQPTVKRASAVATTGAAAGRSYWVQVGAFRNEATAKRLAAKLREDRYEVHEFTTRQRIAGSSGPASDGPSATDRYDVFVSGIGESDLNARLAPKGLTAEGVAGGAVIKPSLALRDAVALSRELTADGIKVQVKRAPGAGAPAAADGTVTLYRVRVGTFADRAAARAAARELEAKGYRVFIARGPA